MLSARRTPMLPRSMRETEIPESDRLGEFPHPRMATHLTGQAEAEKALFDAFMSGRMQHAWLMTGPKGIGKATLAYRRFVYTSDEADEEDRVEMFGGSLINYLSMLDTGHRL